MSEQPQTIEEAWAEYAGYAERLGIETHLRHSRKPLGELMEEVHEHLPEGMTPAEYFDPGEQATYEIQMWYRQGWSSVADRLDSRDEAKARIDGFADLNPDLPFRILKVAKEVVG